MAEQHRRKKRNTHKTKRTASTGHGGRYIEGSQGRPEFEQPPSGGGGTGGGGGGGGQGGGLPPDHLGIPGLPADIAAKVEGYFSSIPDPQEAQRQAITYLMTTPWFATNYNGYTEGLQRQMFRDPFSGGLADYKAYEKQSNDAYLKYYGRAVTRQEISSFITLGYNANQVGQVGQGHAFAQANRGDLQFQTGAYGGGQLTEQELQAYGEQQSGLNSELGMKIEGRVQKAIATASRLFQGTLGQSALGDQAINQTLQNRRKGDIAA